MVDIKCRLFAFVTSLVLPMSTAFAAPAPKSIDLQSQHFAQTPLERMKSIEKACEDLGIDKFDVYGDYSEDATSSYLRKFEAEVAGDFGKEDAVFMPSGTMAQNIALLIHSRKEHLDTDDAKSRDLRFGCHDSSHLLLWEEESYSKLVGMRAIPIVTNLKSECEKGSIHTPPMRLKDVESLFRQEKERLNMSDTDKAEAEGSSLSLFDTGLSTLIIELPHRELGGQLPPWEDVVSMGELCRENGNGVKFHCDGARIFEASAGYGKSLSELAAPFDSFYISFYKGLGSISGAMLMGNKEFCDEARVWLTRFGGNLYTKLPYAVPGWAGYRRNAFGHGDGDGDCSVPVMTFTDKFNKLKRVTSRIESETAFSEIATFNPIVPETNMVHVYLKKTTTSCESARDEVFESLGVKVFTRLREIPSSDSRNSSAGYKAYFEWTLGEGNGSVDDESFVEAWKQFSIRLREH